MTRLALKYGMRGLWLMGFGIMWSMLGVAGFIAHNPPQPGVIHEHVPIALRSILWLATGSWAIVTGLRGPDVDDSHGHGALYVMPALLTASYFVSWLTFLATTAAHHLNPGIGVVGFELGWFAALFWTVFCVTLALGARWPNPDPTLLPRPPECEDGQP